MRMLGRKSQGGRACDNVSRKQWRRTSGHPRCTGMNNSSTAASNQRLVICSPMSVLDVLLVSAVNKRALHSNRGAHDLGLVLRNDKVRAKTRVELCCDFGCVSTAM